VVVVVLAAVVVALAVGAGSRRWFEGPGPPLGVPGPSSHLDDERRSSWRAWQR